MSHYQPFPKTVRRSGVALFVASVISLSLVVLLIVAIGALAANASVAMQAPAAPRQQGLEIQNQVRNEVLVYDWLTYTVAFTNASGQTLQNVAITDTWITDAASPKNPALAEYNGNLADPLGLVDSYTWTVGTEGGALYIYIGTLNPGVAATLAFTMGVPDSLEPNLKNPAVGPSILGNSVDIGASTPGIENANDTDTTLVVGPVLKLEKTMAAESGLEGKERPGRLVTYTLSLRNLNEEEDGRADAWPATQIEVWEDLPGDLAFVDAQPPGQWSYIAAARRISWSLPVDYVLDPGETSHFTFTARVTTTKSHYSIKNDNSACATLSAERLTPAYCVGDVGLNVLSPLEKMVSTEDPPSSAEKTFPGRLIMYTVYVYNPLQIPVSDLTITDTLPAPFFTFDSMVGGGPSPTGFPTSTVVWEGLSLPANGVLSFTFRVFVDEQTPLTSSCGDKTYKNSLFAASSVFPVVYETDQFSFKHVQVTKQIKMSKSRIPSEQLPGELVTYTIDIENLGDTPVNIPILTDTLPPDFRYHSMVSSPPGAPAGQTDNRVWWDDLPTIGAGEIFEFSFRATVDGAPLTKYKNGVAGFSPDTQICAIDTASVKVLSPIVGSKEANPPHPEPVVQGESFEYTVSYGNLSSLQSYFVDEFFDELPDGFFDEDGNDVYIYAFSAEELEPDLANSWDHTFPVQVVGEGAGTDWCDALASEGKRKFFQAPGSFGIHTTDLAPGDYWVNLSKEAPVYVKPHVDLTQSYYPGKVGPGGTTTVTLSLVNNTRGALAQPINEITLTYELPLDWTYVGTLPGTPEPDLVGGELVWYSIDLPVSGMVELSFQLAAPTSTGKASGIQSYAVAADPDICIPRTEATLEVVKGVTLRKTPNPKEVGPFSTVEYNIEVNNLTEVAATGIRITDMLPFGFEFIEMTSDHTPVSLAPLVWEIPHLAASAKENVRFKVRAYVNLGPQYNLIEGIGASTYVTLAKDLEDYLKDVKVTVVPGVGLYKTVAPAQTQAGQPVTYTINLYNGSNKDMANIVLTDTLPAGFSFDRMIEGQEPVLSQGSLVVWQLAELNKTDTQRLIFRVDTAPDLFSGIYYNQVSGQAWDASAPYGSIDVPDTDLTAPIAVQGLPTVERSKTVSPTTVRAGKLVTYVIRLYNDMDQAQTLRLTDTLPVSLTFHSVVPPTPEPVLTSPVVWEDLSVRPQEVVSVVFRARVDLYTRSGIYYNRLDAEIAGRELPPVSRLAPLQVEEIPRYDLQISKSDGEVTADEGELLQYTITYTNVNEAALTLTNVVITDSFSPLPPYAHPAGGDWGQVATNVYTYVLGDLGPGASGAVQFGLQLSDTIPTSVWVVSNTVQIGHDTDELAFETDPSNNHYTDLDILRGPDLIPADLQIAPDNPTVGETVTFSVTVRNQGKDGTVNAAGDTWFLVELYLKDTGFTPAGPPVDVFDHAGGWWRDASQSEERPAYLCTVAILDANSEETCTFVITDISDVDDYEIYVQVDVTKDLTEEPWGHDYGTVLEAIESNNISFYGVIHIREHDIYLPVLTKNR